MLLASPICSSRRAFRFVRMVQLLRSTREDVERYYQAAIDGYYADRGQSCGWAHPEVTPIADAAFWLP